MSFYPRYLNSHKYMAEVCDHLYCSLEGIKHWNASFYESEIEKQIYLNTFEACQKICKDHDMHPQKMLDALNRFSEDFGSHPKFKLSDYLRNPMLWLRKPQDAHGHAIEQVKNLAEGIFVRYLP